MTIRACTTIFRNLTPKTRNFYTHVIARNVNKTEQVLSKKIDAPKEVYYGILTPQIKAVKFFSLSSSMVGILAQPWLYPAVVNSGSIPVIVTAYSLIGFFTCVTPLLLHFITKRYVTQLIYNPTTNLYTAKTVNFFCITVDTEFHPEDVKVPDVPGMFTTLLAKNKPLFFDPKMFPNPEHYIRIMGYDKPIDFKLYESVKKETSKKI